MGIVLVDSDYHCNEGPRGLLNVQSLYKSTGKFSILYMESKNCYQFTQTLKTWNGEARNMMLCAVPAHESES